MAEGEHFADPEEPFPELEPDDMYRLADWMRNDAPEWMDNTTVGAETWAMIDHAETPEPDYWDRVTISHGPGESDSWILTIETEEEIDIIDLGDNWSGAWDFFDWVGNQWPDVETEVEVAY